MALILMDKSKVVLLALDDKSVFFYYSESNAYRNYDCANIVFFYERCRKIFPYSF